MSTLNELALKHHTDNTRSDVYAGFDPTAKRAHPAAFTAANPDPVTIHDDAQWSRCIPREEARAALDF